MQPYTGYFNQLFVGSEHVGRGPRENLHEQESQSGDGRTHLDGQGKDLAHPLRFPGSVIVSSDRLHPLAKPDNEHDEQDAVAVDDAVGAHRQIAALGSQAAVEDDGYRASGQVDQERGHPDGQDIVDDFPGRFEIGPGKADESVLLEEEMHGLDGGHEHGNDGGDGRSLDSPVEPEDENRG